MRLFSFAPLTIFLHGFQAGQTDTDHAVVPTLRSTCDRCFDPPKRKKREEELPIRRIIVYGTLLMDLFCSAPMTRSQSGIRLRWMLLKKEQKRKTRGGRAFFFQKKLNRQSATEFVEKKKMFSWALPMMATDHQRYWSASKPKPKNCFAEREIDGFKFTPRKLGNEQKMRTADGRWLRHSPFPCSAASCGRTEERGQTALLSHSLTIVGEAG